jgi:DNA-binding HxlR family transcriptional regulator
MRWLMMKESEQTYKFEFKEDKKTIFYEFNKFRNRNDKEKIIPKDSYHWREARVNGEPTQEEVFLEKLMSATNAKIYLAISARVPTIVGTDKVTGNFILDEWSEGHCTQKELNASIGVSRPMISDMLSALEFQGFIVKQKVTPFTDKRTRRNLIFFTQKHAEAQPFYRALAKYILECKYPEKINKEE